MQDGTASASVERRNQGGAVAGGTPRDAGRLHRFKAAAHTQSFEPPYLLEDAEERAHAGEFWHWL